MKTKNMKTLDSRKSIGRSPLRLGFLLIPLALACSALSPKAQAACQEGCLTNQNTVLGDDAFFSLTTGPTTRPLAIKRCIATQLAAKTRPPALVRSIATPPAAKTRPSVLTRLLATTATLILPSVLMRSLAIRPGPTTRLTVLMRSIATSTPAIIRRSVIKRERD